MKTKFKVNNILLFLIKDLFEIKDINDCKVNLAYINYTTFLK